jgi:DNA primase
VLLSELNKILIQERRKTEKEKPRGEHPEEFVPAMPVEEIAPTKLDAQSMVQLQERETIRLLLNYADKAVEDHTLSEFIMQELDDVTFTNPVYKQIYESFKSGAMQGNVPDSNSFLKSSSPEIKNTVTELITARYDTSKHWNSKNIFFSKENDIVNELALSNVLRLKFRMVQKMMEENLQKIKEAEVGGSWEQLEQALIDQTGLKDAERELAKMLGIVVAK